MSDSPYIVDAKNPFSVLMDITEAEEQAEAAAAAATKAPTPKKQGGFIETIGAVVQSIKENAGSTPVARRTRAAAK